MNRSANQLSISLDSTRWPATCGFARTEPSPTEWTAGSQPAYAGHAAGKHGISAGQSGNTRNARKRHPEIAARREFSQFASSAGCGRIRRPGRVGAPARPPRGRSRRTGRRASWRGIGRTAAARRRVSRMPPDRAHATQHAPIPMITRAEDDGALTRIRGRQTIPGLHYPALRGGDRCSPSIMR